MDGPFQFPDIDPVALRLGPLAIRWYALAYIAGLVAGWGYILLLLRRAPKIMTADDVGDFFSWAVIGVIAGGRLGYVLFYMPGFYIAQPLHVFRVWDGGMSFHGGLLGVVVAIVAFSKRRQLPVLAVGDLVACAAPIGLLLGRVANFINGELFGRPTGVAWGIVFPAGGPVPRHPSQLYEAAMEGVVLFAVLFVAVRYLNVRRRPGLAAGLFLTGYGAARSVAELYREPDAHLGLLAFGTTMGQWLSAPLWIAGLALVWYAMMRPGVPA